MKGIKLIFGLLTLATIFSCNPKTQKDDSKFHGMWSLDKFESFDSLTNSWTVDTTRGGMSGYILYDGQGHMGVHLLTSAKTTETVYFTNYNLTGTTIEHNRLTATEPRNWGTTLTRDFDFNGDTLILTPHESIVGQKLRLKWIKL